MSKNARFLFWWGEDFVKLTLKPGQSLSCFNGGPDEEGYNACEVTFSYENDGMIYREDETWGRDCDGNHSANYKSYCHVNHLKAHKVESGELTPQWLHLDSSQYDQYAEIAGY